MTYQKGKLYRIPADHNGRMCLDISKRLQMPLNDLGPIENNAIVILLEISEWAFRVLYKDVIGWVFAASLIEVDSHDSID